MKWLFNAGNALVMSFLFGCDGGLRRSFFGTNFLWLGWEIKAIFFLGRVAFDIDMYKRVLCRTNGFLSTDFFLSFGFGFSIGFQLFALRNLFLSCFVSTCLFGGAFIDTWNLMG